MEHLGDSFTLDLHDPRGDTRDADARLAIQFNLINEDPMSDQGTEILRRDVQTLIQDAKNLFHDASALGSEEAEDLRRKGTSLLHQALDTLSTLEHTALRAGREFANDTNAYVHEKPWMAVGLATGVGILVGMLISRR